MRIKGNEERLSAWLRPAPFWAWNDRLSEEELRRQIREMAKKGWGGYFMHSRVGLVTGYLSEEWMSLVSACAEEAKKTDTFAWLYDEDKWPSGFAGGEVPKKGETFRARALVLVKKGFRKEKDTVLSTITHSGVDYEICKRVSSLGDPWFNGTCYVDLMNPGAVAEFLRCTHERYKEHCGKYFGKEITGIFTDEPCYCCYSTYQEPVVPWSDYLPDFFREEKGYEILEKLPLLFFDLEGYRKVRFDFYDAATELFKRSFTKQYYDWCTANNLIMTGHFMAEDSLRFQTQWSGDVMSHYEYMHWPGIDKLSRTISEIVTVKQVSSAVDQLGKERAFCEAFGATGQQVSFFHRKWIGDWLAVLGINFINHHLSLYSMRGERKRDFPPNFFYQQPWWEDERGFADYQARVCLTINEGRRLVNILLLQPLSSVWCEYSPLHAEQDYVPENLYDQPFARISKMLMEEKLDFHYGNEKIMAKYGSVEGRALKVGRFSYTCVIVPPSLNLRSTTLALLEDFVRNGGHLIFAVKKPSLVDGEEKRIELSGSILSGTLQEAVEIASRSFPQRIRVLDGLTGSNAPNVYVHSRQTGDTTHYFIVNTDEKRAVKAKVVLPEWQKDKTALLDLSNGKAYRLEREGSSFEVTLAPAGSLLLLSGDQARQVRAKTPLFLGSGAYFYDLSKEAPEILIEKFDCQVLEENILLLNNFLLEMAGEKVYEGPVCGAWHSYFYPAAEGTPFKATYSFYSQVRVRNCFAAIEVAQNLDSIMFNGKPVTPSFKQRGQFSRFSPKRNWKDINFTKVWLPEIKEGVNTLVIFGKKVNNITGPGLHLRLKDWQNHYPTEAEEVYIGGHFSLKRYSDAGYMITAFQKPSGKNLTEEGFPFYCGRVILRANFRLNLRPSFPTILLRLNGASFASAVIRVNRKYCGTLRWEPLVLDISRAVVSGQNLLEIEMAPTLVNAFGPNRRAGVKEETGIGPHSFIEMARFKEGYELFDFGIASVSIYQIYQKPSERKTSFPQ